MHILSGTISLLFPCSLLGLPTNLGGSSSSVISFCLFILFMQFSRQEYWCGFPFPSPVDGGETKSGIQPLAAQKPIKKAGLVERKVCFVLDVGKWWGNTGGQTPVQRLTPLHWQPRYGSFYRQTEGAPMQKQHSEPQQSPWNWSSVVWLASPSLFQVQLVFSSRVGLIPFLRGHFSELWQLMS